MDSPSFQVLLYYKYITLDNPEKIRDEQRKLCESLSLKGRIIVSYEGINGTLEGIIENTEKYIKAMGKSKSFKDISFKKSKGTGEAFFKLSVKVRPEIVSAHMSDINPNETSGRYLSADELHNWYTQKKEFFIVDMRNDYEYLSGYFEGSTLPMIHNFYDLPTVLPKLKYLKGKTVVTVCTGGVRCEKASGFLVKNGFEDVYQLKDGIHTYIEKYPDGYFKGRLYVFDNRLTIGFNSDAQSEVVGRCMHCDNPSESYVNCAYGFCHYHYICCNSCLDSETNLAFCKKECKVSYLAKI